MDVAIESLLVIQVLLPWTRREPSADPGSIFDARVEQARLSERVMRLAAQLLGGQAEAGDATLAQVQAFCDGLVDASPHLRLCWTWFGAVGAEEVVPQIAAGPARDYALQLRIPRTVLTSFGPAFRVIDGHRLEPFNVNSASLYTPWRDAAVQHGVRSVLALPLTAPNDERRGIFVLYADVPDYFGQVGLGLFDAMAQLIGSVLSQVERRAALERLARTDALTGLHNRTAALELIEGLRQGHAQRPVSLLLLDLDHFKQVNDTHGHAMGDQVLSACARRLRTTLRRHDGSARWGGEEFVVWLPDCRSGEACLVAEKLRAGVAALAHALPDGRQLRVTLSIGLVEQAPGETVLQALERADHAMYASKQAGRDRVSIG